MSPTTEAEDVPRGGNNPAPRSSQNKPQLLQATMRNVPKLKELNYTQWKNVITNSIKNAKLWGYVDGSIEQPSEENVGDLEKYYDEAGAVRNAILGSLESAAQRYIEEALDPRDAWLTLEKKYLSAEADVDAKLVSIEKELTDLRLEEDGDIVEHLVNFCGLRRRLHGTRFALDEQSSIELLYRSLPPGYRQSILTPGRTETKDFSALCVRLRDLDLNKTPNTQAPVADISSTEDYTCWGVPADVKAFGLTGDKNPLLEARAAVTCRDCLLKDHESGTPECPQYEWRKELWGAPSNSGATWAGDSEPIKVALDFDELGLRKELRNNLRSSFSEPTTIEQCAIFPILNSRNVLAQAPRGNGKTATIVISILQMIDPSLPCLQAVVLAPTEQAVDSIRQTIQNLKGNSGAYCYTYNSLKPVTEAGLDTLILGSHYRIIVGTPGHLLELIQRNILGFHKLKIVALDDVDKLIESGSDEQILELHQHVPPSTQIVATSTTMTMSASALVTKLLVNPVQIIVNHAEGVTAKVPHFFVKVLEDQKPNFVNGSLSALSVNRMFTLCSDIDKIASNSPDLKVYQLPKTMNREQCQNLLRDFQRNAYGRATLLISDTALPIEGLANLNFPLIICNVPDNVEEYAKRLDDWRKTNTNQPNLIITLVRPDTNDIQVLHDYEQYRGVRVVSD